MYQEALCNGIKAIGHDSFQLVLTDGRPFDLRLCSKNGNKLINSISELIPDAIFLYRVESILSSCLKTIRKNYPNIPILTYHNDDPFNKGLKRRIKYYHFLSCIKNSDITYVYRPVNIEEAYEWGAKVVKLFMSHYNSKTDLVDLPDSAFEKKTDEVAFIGHYEPDNRVDIIDYLIKHGVNIHIYGDDWKQTFIKHGWPLERQHPGASGADYRALIKKVGIALAFFSAKNRDEYTRRCFEIPIMGTLIAAPLTSVTKQIYKDGENAILYSGKVDLLNKVNYYSLHIEERNKMAKNGYYNIKNGDFSEISRAEMVIDDIGQLIKYKKI